VIPLSKMPPEAEDVLRTIRWWERKTGRGATLLELQCTCKGHPIATKRGLDWLKRRRIVSWTPEGRATRYAEAKTRATEAA